MENEDEENYLVIGNYGFYKLDDVIKPAARTLFESMDDDNPALTTAALLLAIYSSLESKIPDSQQIKFKQDVWEYLEISFPDIERFTTVK